jgi:hypothetical protein
MIDRSHETCGGATDTGEGRVAGELDGVTI